MSERTLPIVLYNKYLEVDDVNGFEIIILLKFPMTRSHVLSIDLDEYINIILIKITN